MQEDVEIDIENASDDEVMPDVLRSQRMPANDEDSLWADEEMVWLTEEGKGAWGRSGDLGAFYGTRTGALHAVGCRSRRASLSRFIEGLAASTDHFSMLWPSK